MFKEKNERKENTVQSSHWTTQPQFLRSFDDYSQYLDCLSVLYGNWSSRDPGHMERTDFSEKDYFDAIDSTANGENEADTDGDFGVDDTADYTEGFLVKDRSRALRRRSTALHKLHVQKLSKTLSKESHTGAAYKRVSVLQPQCVELITWYEELESLRKIIGNENVNALYAMGFDNTALEVKGLRLSDHKVGTAPVVGIRAMNYEKYVKLLSRDTHHEKKRAKSQKAAEIKVSKHNEVVNSTGAEVLCEEIFVIGGAIFIRTEDFFELSKEDVVLTSSGIISETTGHENNCRYYIDRHVSSIWNVSPQTVKLRETKVPVVLAEPELIPAVIYLRR